MPKGGRALAWLLRVGVTVGIVVYILVDVDRYDLLRALSGIDLRRLGIAAALYLFGQTMSAFRWGQLARSVGFKRPRSDYTRFYFIGMFFNVFGISTIGNSPGGSTRLI